MRATLRRCGVALVFYPSLGLQLHALSILCVAEGEKYTITVVIDGEYLVKTQEQKNRKVGTCRWHVWWNVER